MPFWPRYVPAAERRTRARKALKKLLRKGVEVRPVELAGRTIARSFWGKGWCDHLESFSDYENRLPRGRTYVRNGSVCHLDVQSGRIEALVSGSRLYQVSIITKKLKPAVWKSIKKNCTGQVGSMLELLQGRLSDRVMTVVADRKKGLFPQPGELAFSCSCPDWAVMCKHVAAVLYGVGNRLDDRPELLFLLRDVDAHELISAGITLPKASAGKEGETIAPDRLGEIFGIELETDSSGGNRTKSSGPARRTRKTPSVSAARKKGKAHAVRKPSPARKTVSAAGSRGSVPVKHGRADKQTATVPTPRPTGKAIARLRTLLGQTVEQFAEKLGVSPASVRRWEATKGRPGLQARSLTALARIEKKAGKIKRPQARKKSRKPGT